MIDSTDDALASLLKPARLTHVVDIGANPIDGDAPYKAMLERRLCRVTGFDPHPEALARLNAAKGDLETYLPYAIGDGARHTLKICRGIGFASLLQPDEKALSHFPRFPELGRVIGESPLSTQRLDDIAELAPFDLLKIDIQGSELSVFRNGHARLAQAIAVHTEVSFVPLYKDQPVFGDVDLELRSLGFIPHMFAAINRKMIAPMLGATPAVALNQLVEASTTDIRSALCAQEQDRRWTRFLDALRAGVPSVLDYELQCAVDEDEEDHEAAGDIYEGYGDPGGEGLEDAYEY